MTRKKDSFWEYAEHLNGRFKCNFCERDFAGGAPRIKSHLSGVKGRDIDICTKVPIDVQVAAAATIKGVHKRPKTEAFSSNSDEISSEVCEKNDSSVLDSSLAKFLLMNNVDCGVVKSPSFIDFVNALAAFGPTYNLPSCSTLETVVIPGLLREVEAHVSNTKESWGETGCTIISDVWCDDKENRSFVNIMAHSPKGLLMLHSVEVPKDKSASDFLEVMVSFSIQTVGATNVVQYINGAQSVASTGCLLAKAYPQICVTPCVASEIQSLFEEIYTEHDWVRAAVDNAKCLDSGIYGHKFLLSLMRKHTNNRELRQPQLLELSSNYDMLLSIIEVRSELLQLVQSPEWISLNDGTQESRMEMAKIIHSSEFWNQVKEVVLALEPFYEVLNLVDRYGSSSGYLYEAMEIATKKVRRIYDDNPTKYKRLWEIFDSGKRKIVHPIHTAAACLNPAYMYTHMCRNEAKVYEVMEFLVENIVAHADKKAFVKEMMEYHNREPKFFSDTEKIMLETYHPCKWWDYCGRKLPVLRKYAIRILSQPCSSSACKQGLSAFRSAQMKQQQRFAVESPSSNLHLRMNMILTANFNARATSDKPIDLTELGPLKFIDRSFPNDLSNGEVANPLDLQPSHRSGFGFSSKQNSSQKSFQLQFVTRISSPQVTGQEIKGEHGSPIHVFLIDPVTGGIVQDDGVSALNLTVSALQGDFDEDARNDWTREDFIRSEISDIPIMTGNLQVNLRNGMGTLGAFHFNFASSFTRSGKFRLGVKTSTGDSEGVRIRDCISNAFVVESVEVTRRHDATAYQTRLPEDSDPTNNMYQLGPLWSPSQNIVDGDTALDDQFFEGIWDAEAMYKHKQKGNVKLRQAAIGWLKLKAILKWAILRRIVMRNRAQRVVVWNQAQKRLYEWSKGGEWTTEEHMLKGHTKMYFQDEPRHGIHKEKEELPKPLQKEEQELIRLAGSSDGDPPGSPRPVILQQDHSLTLFPSLLTGQGAELHTEDEVSEKGDDKMVHEQSEPMKSTTLNAGESAAPSNVDRPGNPLTLFPSLFTECRGSESVEEFVMVPEPEDELIDASTHYSDTANQHLAPSSEMDWEMISWRPSRKLHDSTGQREYEFENQKASSQGNEEYQLSSAPSKAAIRWPKFRSSSRWLSMFTSSASEKEEHNIGSRSGKHGEEELRVDQSSVISGWEPECSDSLSTEFSESPAPHIKEAKPSTIMGALLGSLHSHYSVISDQMPCQFKTPLHHAACYRYGFLKEVTKGFSRDNVIGEGGDGVVYRGKLADGMPVAVKVLNNSGLSEKQLKLQAELQSSVRHKNLVQVLGYCTEGTNRLLVYEYMPNGDLEKWLYGPRHQRRHLSWDARIKIASGVAQALAFLHEETRSRVVHGDIKSSNILLDKDFNAKLSDFGNARLMDGGKSHDMNKSVGTSLFLDPEGANSRLHGEKADIYSFGVVLVTLIRGRDTLAYERLAHGVNLAEWLDGMVRSGRIEPLLDPSLEIRPSTEALEWFVRIALECLDPDTNKRPKMSEVARMLEKR